MITMSPLHPAFIASAAILGAVANDGISTYVPPPRPPQPEVLGPHVIRRQRPAR